MFHSVYNDVILKLLRQRDRKGVWLM